MRFVTKGINLSGLLGLASVVVLVALFVFISNREGMVSVNPIGTDQGRHTLPAPPDPRQPVALPDEPEPVPERGVYQNYSEERLRDVPARARVVLFFYAERCGSCRAVDDALYNAAEEIPSDVYIFRVNYDRALALRRQHSVDVPHTFVELDGLGRRVQRWTGSMGLEAILARL